MRNLFEIWKQHHFPKTRSFNFESLKISGEINSLHAAVTMLVHGLGWSVLPLHVVDAELKKSDIQVFPGTEKNFAKSEIYIVSLKALRQPARVKAVLAEFWKMKK